MSEFHPGPSQPVQHHEAAAPHSPTDNPTGTAAVLYEALRATAQHAGEARGYVRSTTHVTLHCPLEVVALSLGRHRVTVWRAARKLKALGLVDARPHKTTALNGRTVNDGTLWAVRLNPDEGTPARLTVEELKHEWRDLDRDRRRGRTAHRTARERMQQSKTLPVEGFDLELLLAWSLPSGTQQNPVKPDCCTGSRRDLEAVLDVPYAATDDRGAMVEAGAQALAAGLRDAGGLMFYRWLLWQLLRLQDRHGSAPWHTVYEGARRARADAAEGFARRPGALFVSRLKAGPWWDELRRVPAVRVGVRPRGS